MATSSVDKNNNAEVISRNREAAKKQEAALKKKHAEEVSRIQKQYGERIRELQQEYDEQLDAVKDRSRESLSAKDKKYQSEIEKIKTTQSQAAKNSAQNYDRQIREQKETYRDENKKMEKIHDTQMKSLSKNYEKDVAKKEEAFTNAADEMREKQDEAITNVTEKLRAKNEKDLDWTREHADEKINDLTNKLQDTREEKDGEIRGLKVSNLSDREDMEADKMGLINQERLSQGAIQDNMRDTYFKNIDELREKYSTANTNAKLGRGVELENMKNRAEVRQNEQMGNLERRMRENNAKNDNERYLAQQSFRQEKENYMNASKEALEKAEQQRSMVYDSVNDRTSKEIKGIVNKNAENFDRQGKYYQERLNDKDMKYDESIEKQVKSLQIENNQDKVKADSRQQKITHIMGQERNEMESYYKDVLNEKDRIHKEAMTEQRVALIKERNEAVSKLESRIRDIDAKNNEKINTMINRYENAISDMKEEHKAEKKRIVDQGNRRLDEAEKTYRFQTEAEKEATKNREDQMKEKFERSISTMEAKHDQEKIRIATNIKR